MENAEVIGDAEFDLREQLTRIDRSIAETGKLQEEARKYAAETRRLNREDRYFPWLQIVSSSAIAALIGAIVARWH
jgi:hypothetical protein